MQMNLETLHFLEMGLLHISSIERNLTLMNQGKV